MTNPATVTAAGVRSSPRKSTRSKEQIEGGKNKPKYENPTLFIIPDAGPAEFMIFPVESRFVRTNDISLVSIVENFGGKLVSEPTEHAISLVDALYMKENDLWIPPKPDRDWPNDLYSSTFVYESIHHNKLVDLNKHRLVPSYPNSLFEAHDANDILFKQQSWKQLKKKSSKSKKGTRVPIGPVPETPFARDGTSPRNMVDQSASGRIESFTSTPNNNVSVTPNAYHDPLESGYSKSDNEDHDSLNQSSVLKDNTNRNDSPEFFVATPVAVAPKRTKPMPVSERMKKEEREHEKSLRSKTGSLNDSPLGRGSGESGRSKPAQTPEPESAPTSPYHSMLLRNATKSTPNEASRSRKDKSPQPCSSKSLRVGQDANANAPSTVSLLDVARNRVPSGDRVSPILDFDVYDIEDDEDGEDERVPLKSGGRGMRTSPKPLYGRVHIGKKRRRNEFTLSEDKKILKLIVKNNWYTRTKGNAMWQEIEEQFDPHTYQSIKERFKKKLVRDAHFREFNLTEDQIRRLRANFENVRRRN